MSRLSKLLVLSISVSIAAVSFYKLHLLLPATTGGVTPAGEPVGDPGRPECPGVDSSRYSVAASTPISDIPEFHDCQRLILSSGKYGPLIAVFTAKEVAASYWDVVGQKSAAERLAASNPNYGGAQLTVYGYPGWGDYAEATSQLGIVAGFNCIYLHKAGAGWTARIWQRPASTNGAECKGPLPAGPAPDIRELPVEPMTFPGFRDADVPPVARWERSRSGAYVIGTKCGSQWCRIGTAGAFIPEDTLQTSEVLALYDLIHSEVGSVSPVERERVWRVPGWSDVQQLSRGAEAVGGPGTIRPDTVIGLMVPNPKLDGYKMADYPLEKWNWVAAIFVHPVPGAGAAGYAKLHLSNGMNVVYLRRSEVSPGVVHWQTMIVATPLAAAAAARNRLIAALADTLPAFNVIRRDHSGVVGILPNFSVPGAPRWRWHPNDEVGWLPCDLGCCETMAD